MQDGTTVALREVILHMVEEYARHLGHADLLRERIDGLGRPVNPQRAGCRQCWLQGRAPTARSQP